MTSLLPAPRPTPPDDARADVTRRRPLVLLAALAGLGAAGATLLVCLAGGVIGWFLTDAGAHGAPRDGLRVGATGWLMAHGSGVHVGGVPVTAVPLGLSLVIAIVVWRLGLRLGDLVSGHGPDADAIADGVRDWTVASATAVFTLGYVAVLVVTHHLATTPATRPSLARALGWAVLLCVAVGGTAIAVGSGPRGHLDVVPPPLATGGRRRCVAHPGLVRRGVARGVRGRPRRRLGRRGQRDVAAAHESRRRHPPDRALPPAAAARHALQRLLPARPRLRRRDAHPRDADGGDPRRAADVPAAGGPARRRADPGVGPRPARGPAAWSPRSPSTGPCAATRPRAGTRPRCAAPAPG